MVMFCISQKILWVPTTAHSCPPSNAVVAGSDSDGTVIYVGRAYHEGDLLPAKVIPGKQAAYIAYGGREIFKENFEILTGYGFDWIPCSKGYIHPNAVASGTTSSGETLYIARVYHKSSLTVGKVHPSHQCCYIPYNGKEISFTEYDALTQKSASSWVPYDVHAPIMAGAIMAGYESDGSTIYVGRANYAGDLLPAKVLPSKNAAYITHDGIEHVVHKCEVLCHGDLTWISTNSGNLMQNAVLGGHTLQGENLYIGRVHHEYSLTPGKIQPNHECLYIPYGGQEIAYQNYEILTEK